MHPHPPKHEHEIADALETWAEQERTLKAHGKDYDLNTLRISMSAKREQFEFLEREAKAKHGNKKCEAMCEDLFSGIREYAQQRRLEEITRNARGNPMEVSQANQTNQQQAHYGEEWPADW